MQVFDRHAKPWAKPSGIKIEKSELITYGTSILPNESGIIVKILGNNTEDIFEKVYDIVKITRKEILDAEFTKLRKN